MNQILGWIGLISLIFVFYLILKPQEWEKNILKDEK